MSQEAVPTMHNARRVREASHVAKAAKQGYRNDISKPPSKRMLSMNTVMEDMRTILWPDRSDQECGDIDFTSEDGAEKQRLSLLTSRVTRSPKIEGRRS
jgi:hypothetical protein